MNTYIKTKDGDILRVVGENSAQEIYICEYLDGSKERIEVKYHDVVCLDTNEYYVRNF